MQFLLLQALVRKIACGNSYMYREIPPKTLVLNGIISKVCVGIVGNNHLIQLSPTIFQAFKIIYA